MDNYLLLQKNSRMFLFVHYPDRYHIISVNKQFTDEKEEKLLSGTCSDAVIDEMGLTRTTILKQDLRGVAIGGCEAGDVLVLYTKSKKLNYVLSDDSREEDMEIMFQGIERFNAPKSKSKKEDWRKDIQVESQKKKMKVIGFALNTFGALAGLGAPFIGFKVKVLFAACYVIPIITLFMYLKYPQYFTMMDWKSYDQRGYTARVTKLITAVIVPMIGLAMYNLYSFYYPSWKIIAIESAIIAISSCVLLFYKSREFRENIDMLIAYTVILLVFAHGFICTINHHVNRDRYLSQPCTITELRYVDGSKSDSYYFHTYVNDTLELELPISSYEYNLLEPGDVVEVYYGTGALGIDYAYLVSIP